MAATTIDSIIQEAAAIESQANDLWDRAKRLKVLANAMRKNDKGASFLDGNGKMTEAGVRQMSIMFARGDKVSEVAKFFGITQSAVSYRLARWNAGSRRK